MLRKVGILSSIIAFAFVTIGTFAYILQTSLSYQPTPMIDAATSTPINKPAKQSPAVIAGKPTRLVIADRDIDLVVNDGYYDQSTGAWTLSDTQAQFAVMTSRPNNHAGMTFIYGHGTDAVFGRIGSNPPSVGSVAKLYTKNKRVFTYKLASVRNLQPNDTSIFKKARKGKPRLVVQTCTGLFSEWRTMFTYVFKKVSTI